MHALVILRRSFHALGILILRRSFHALGIVILKRSFHFLVILRWNYSYHVLKISSLKGCTEVLVCSGEDLFQILMYQSSSEESVQKIDVAEAAERQWLWKEDLL